MPDRGTQLTPKQVARAIGVSESSVKRWCDTGLIETVRTAGGHRRLLLESVQKFLRETGQEVVAPEVLGLPSTTGATARILGRACDLFEQALVVGDESVARQVIFDLRDAGHSLGAILDQVLLAGMANLRERAVDTGETSYRDQHAAEIVLRILHDLRSQVVTPKSSEFTAITAALDGAPDTVRVTAAELILCATGWQATSLGRLLPFATLIQAIETQRPRICFIDVAVVRNENELIRQFESLHLAAKSNGTALGVGGDAISEDFVTRLDADQYCGDLTALESWAKALESSAP